MADSSQTEGTVQQPQQQPLRNRLFQLAVVGILPLAMLSGIGLYALIEGQREQAMRIAVDFARGIGVAVDGELRRVASGLELLATSSELDERDPSAFSAPASRVLAREPTWQALVLARTDGTVVLDVARDADTHFSVPAAGASPRAQGPPPTIVPRTAIDPVRESVVSSLARDEQGRYVFGVAVPVVRDGVQRFTLTAVVSPDALRQVLDQQRIPDDWVVSIFDGNSRRIARSRAHESYIGGAAAPTLQALMQTSGGEGSGVTTALEGEEVLTSLTRLKRADWIAAIGIAPSSLLASSRNSLAAYGGGIVLSIVLGLLATYFFARSISRPMRSLRDAALSLGQGALPRPLASGIGEIDEVADALVASAQERARVESEREDLLGAERWARTATEEARRRLELLATAGATLSRSLEPQATLDAIARTIVPAISDWCRVDLVDSDGTLGRALTYHSDPDKTRIGCELVARLRAAPDSRGSMAWTVATGESHLARFTQPHPFEQIRDRDLLTFAEAIGMRAYYIVPLTARGRTLGALAALRAESDREFSADDCALITELAQRAALALDNARLFAEADRARREADRANQSKDEFLAMLGHELRNPLAPIVTALHLMERKAQQYGQRDDTERRIIERQVAYLSRLVDDLLDVSRITQGKIQLERERLDLRLIMERALELVQPLSDRRLRPIDVDVPSVPVPVTGDAVRLTQVVTNLLTNAIKFTPPDRRIAVRVDVDVDANNHANAGTATITVTDEGQGIPAELLPRVFELFVQGRQAIDRHSGGLGLGLSIVRTMVAMHGGDVTASSAGRGHGSAFVVRLPMAASTTAAAASPAEDTPQPTSVASTPADTTTHRTTAHTMTEATTPTTPSATPSAATSTTGLRILVVDDNVDAAETLSSMLELSGYDTRTAPDAPSALALLDRFIPDVAVLDIGLPGIDGYELARKLRSDPRTRQVRLIALTGYGREPDRLRALASAFEEHLVKPVSPQRLFEAIARMSGPLEPAAQD